MITGVYCIRNLVTGKRYVGSATRSFAKRWTVHKAVLNKGRHHSKHLQASWNKYGEARFSFEVLERCLPDNCIPREQYWIDSYNSADPNYGYNVSPTAGNTRG